MIHINRWTSFPINRELKMELRGWSHILWVWNNYRGAANRNAGEAHVEGDLGRMR